MPLLIAISNLLIVTFPLSQAPLVLHAGITANSRSWTPIRRHVATSLVCCSSTSSQDPKPKPAPRKKKITPPPPAEPTTSSLGDASLLKLTKVELVDLAVAKGLAKTGTKAALVARILSAIEPKSDPKSESSVVGAAPQEREKPSPTATTLKTTRRKTTTTVAQAKKKTKESSINEKVPELSAYAAQKRNEALEAVGAIARLTTTKRIVLDGQTEAWEVAKAVSIALNAKRRVMEGRKEAVEAARLAAARVNRKLESSRLAALQQEAWNAAKVCATSTSTTSIPTTPKEAAKVLEEVIIHGVGITIEASSTPRSEVEEMKSTMASFKAQLAEHERHTEQVEAVISKVHRHQSNSVTPDFSAVLGRVAASFLEFVQIVASGGSYKKKQ